jgi:cysteinyl-tRNA synthetase
MTDRKAAARRMSPGSLVLPDTLSGRTVPVLPGSGGPVRLYVCGPTVYSDAHVGHARTYLYFDVARRSLEAEGLAVRHVMNVTDVEDKIDRKAKLLGVSSVRLARNEERKFFRDLSDLGVLPPHARPRAGDYVPQMVRIAQRLEKTGRVRHAGDEWIYEPPEHPKGTNFPTGAELARHAVEEPGHPFGGDQGRERSIVIWKRQAPPLPSWPSPWGPGVPGWHLECIAMATEQLGVPVDLHGGARDLVYPHHFAGNEVALALHGRPFSRVFLHTGFVLQNGAKMSKSTGNLVTLRSALDREGAGALRWYLLSRKTSDRLPWEDAEFARAAREYAAVREAFAEWTRPGASGSFGVARAEALGRRVRTQLLHSLRTDAAIAAVGETALALRRAPNARAPRGERTRVRALVRDVERRTGIPLS